MRPKLFAHAEVLCHLGAYVILTWAYRDDPAKALGASLALAGTLCHLAERWKAGRDGDGPPRPNPPPAA